MAGINVDQTVSRAIGLFVLFFAAVLEARGHALVRYGLRVAQAIAWLVFHQLPSRPVLVGGALIVAGGAVMSIWSH